MNEQSPLLPDQFDSLYHRLHGLPDVLETKLTPLKHLDAYGNSTTFTVLTVRQAKQGDTIFLEVTGRDGHYRIVIPPIVAKAIDRQHRALTDKARSKAAKAAQATREALGIVPFQKKSA